jgi:signal peptidase II
LSRLGLYLIALLVLLADQLSKAWVVKTYWRWPDDGLELIPGFFGLTFNVNTGGAFGILPQGTLLLALAAAIAAVAIIVYSLRAPMPLPRLLGVALALPLGGAMGNLLDRVRLHHVVDFLALYAGPHRQWQFPIFNLADTAICTGVGLLALYYGRQPTPLTSAPTPWKEKS